MRAALVAALMALSGPALAAGPQWTWEAGKQANNGAITIKSTNGSTTYTGTQNPTGAVAKVNQNAVTQPPTVIIQATSGQYSEIIPLAYGSTTVPACPAGYISVFKANGTGVPAAWVVNAGGTRLSLGWTVADTNGNSNVGFYVDSPFGGGAGGQLPLAYVAANSSWAGSLAWGVQLCSK